MNGATVPTASPQLTTPPSVVAPNPSSLAYVRLYLSQPVTASFIAGGAAGAVSRTVVSPLERLKILFQVQSSGMNEYKGSVWKGLTRIWQEEGFKGMMRGNGTNCIRIIPYSAVQFGSYNFYKRFMEPSPDADLSPIRRLICGGFAGITSVTFTYPLDIVRTRLSVQSASFAKLDNVTLEKLPGMWGTMKHMHKYEGGFPALYRGIVPTLAGVAPYVRVSKSADDSTNHFIRLD